MSSVKPQVKASIFSQLNFAEGALPFNYLGVPLFSKKLIVAQCMPLVEKIAARVRCYSAKLLSNAGRL